MESPFLTFPFTGQLRDARRRGVRVQVIAPETHSFRTIACYHRWECARSGFELHLLPGMFHVKAMLVDGRRLVLGASNFDYLSYRLLHEILAIVDEPRTVADFVHRVAEVDLARCRSAARRHNGTNMRRSFVPFAAGGRVSGA